tara:strand:+ start:2150 stop:2629 length:480 start_codon:yes stop_codon:yes gene_type:complete
MSKCKTKNRVCTSFTKNLVLFKKNVAISQPRGVHPLGGRGSSRCDKHSRFYKDVKTVNPDTHTTLDSFFSSDGFGQPGSSNRKQRIFNTNKTKLSSTFPNIQNLTKDKTDVKNKQKYKQGFMYKSQANLEANVGSMDRLQRLKATQIRKYSNNSRLFLL